jgi:CheY-like chemotaxis protein
VLLVEDNDTNQLVAVGLLTSLGYQADVAGDGLQACEMTAAGHYDAILMDCQMPLMDGFTATARLRDREQKDRTRTPIIAMTASALAADRQRCLAAGMDDYLAKPVDPDELAHALDRWVLGDLPTPNHRHRLSAAGSAVTAVSAGVAEDADDPSQTSGPTH